MRTIFFLLQKEFIQIFRNKGMLPIIFAVPIVQLIILVNAATFEMKNVNLLIVDKDHSQESARLINKFAASNYYTLSPIASDGSRSQEMLDMGTVDGVLTIPNNFSTDLLRENTASLLIEVNAIDGSSASLVYFYTSSIIRDFNQNLVQDWLNMPQEVKPVITMISSFWYNPELEYKNLMVPGLLVILVTMVGMFLSGMNIVREKELGTIEQINVTPIKKSQFIIGKLFPFWIIGMFELGFGLIIGKLIFDFPIEGSIGLVFSFAAIYLTLVLGMGLLVSTITNTQQQAMLISWFFLVIFVLMSGLFTAIENMPGWAQKITWFNPVAYFVQLIRLILLKGSQFADVSSQFLKITVMALVVNALAIWNYRKRS